MKKRNTWIALLMAAALLATPTVTALADAAPDGKTVNDETTDSTYKAWKENTWESTSSDWTLVSMTPGEDETEMNFAWYSKTTETTSLTYGKKKISVTGRPYRSLQPPQGRPTAMGHPTTATKPH